MRKHYEKAPAKINLALEVLGKLPDGYHALDTVFHSISLADDVILEERHDSRIVVRCENPLVPLGPKNIAYQAAALLRNRLNINKGVTITLIKRIPVAAGLAGGSADAAAVLRGLPKLWGIPANTKDLLALARQLGADVPFCLNGGTQRGTGRGDVLAEVKNGLDFMVAVIPQPYPVSTARVFQLYQPGVPQHRVDRVCEALVTGNYQQLVDNMCNDLEKVTFGLYPELRQKRQTLLESGFPALMSGSGPTLFALLKSESEFEHLKKLLPQDFVVLCR